MSIEKFLLGLDYIGYYDETGVKHIEITKEVAEEVLKRITGAEVDIK